MLDVQARPGYAGVEFVPAVDVNVDGWWMATATSAIKALAETMETFTADDLYEVVPEPLSPAAYGAAMSAAANRGLIEHRGYRRSRRKSRHAGVISVWSKP